jgi:protease I
MRSDSLEGLRVAVLAADGFEQVELTSPVEDLEDRGAEVDIISLRPGRIRGVQRDVPGEEGEGGPHAGRGGSDDYDALLLPGGLANPDALRQSDQVLDFVSAFNAQGKPIAMICHAPVGGGVGRDGVGRRLTSWPGIKHDVLNAGGLWSDEPVVRDRNWVTSRGPHDLPVFNEAVAELFAEHVPLPSLERSGGRRLGMLVGRASPRRRPGTRCGDTSQARADRYEEAPAPREYTSAAPAPVPAPTPAAAAAPMPPVAPMPPSTPAVTPAAHVELERVVIVGDGRGPVTGPCPGRAPRRPRQGGGVLRVRVVDGSRAGVACGHVDLGTHLHPGRRRRAPPPSAGGARRREAGARHPRAARRTGADGHLGRCGA